MLYLKCESSPHPFQARLCQIKSSLLHVTTKILALTDALGDLVDFHRLPGQAHDLRGVPDLIENLAADHLLADRAFDADWLRNALMAHAIAPVISPKRNRISPAEADKWRHLIENFFGSLKDNRVSGIDTRYCKTDTSFSAFISIAATLLWLRGTSTDPRVISDYTKRIEF